MGLRDASASKNAECSGTRCITPPPVAPPETNLKSPVFHQSSEGLVAFFLHLKYDHISHLRYFTLKLGSKPSTDVELGGSTRAWIKNLTPKGRINLVWLVSMGMSQAGRSLIGQHAHQVRFCWKMFFLFFARCHLPGPTLQWHRQWDLNRLAWGKSPWIQSNLQVRID